MSEEDSEAPIPRFAWPPRKEDLQRLYVEEKLSAAKIARVYDLKYASPKTAESTILHHLKKNGIDRRDPAAHVRKVTETMVDEWVIRYLRGESLKQIAGDVVDPVSVFNHLHRRGLQLRDKVEAQIKAMTKFEKASFSGEDKEKAYLIGIAVGDFASAKHGRAVRVKTSTTHPAMTSLFRSLFGEHGPIYEYPRESPLTGFEWSLDCDLDDSYSFLLDLKRSVKGIMSKDDLFLHFLAGFFDADGSIYFHKKKRHGAFEFSLTNMNEELLSGISGRLADLGFSPTLRKSAQHPERGVPNGADFIWRLTLWRYAEVVDLLTRLQIRHPEKKAKAGIALRLGFWSTGEERERIAKEWDSLRTAIKKDCLEYIDKARQQRLAEPKGSARDSNESK